MMQISNDGKKIDRKTIEKNRRTHMKKLCFKLNSLVPSLSSQPFKVFDLFTTHQQSTCVFD
ncbi:putative transcription factor bHLH family [Helianthus debilis subsp. tardiflorus]